MELESSILELDHLDSYDVIKYNGTLWRKIEVADRLEPTTKEEGKEKEASAYKEGFEGVVHLYADRENGERVVRQSGQGLLIRCVLDFRNTGSEALNGWKATFKAPEGFHVEGLKGAEELDRNGEYIVIGSADINARVPVGGTLPQPIRFWCNPVFDRVPVITHFSFYKIKEVLPEPLKEVKNATTKRGKADHDYNHALDLNWRLWMANQMGKKADWNVLKWRSDAMLTDGQYLGRDYSGGYVDAGDHIVLAYSQGINASMMAMSALFYGDSFKNHQSSVKGLNQHAMLENVLKHSFDWFMKCHDIENNKTKNFVYWIADNTKDHAISVKAEDVEKVFKDKGWKRECYSVHPNDRGSEPCAAAAAGMAFGSMVIQDQSYAQKILTHAKILFDFAFNPMTKYKPRYNVYKSVSGAQDELCLAAIALYMATKESHYLDKAKDLFRTQIYGLSQWCWLADNSSYACAFLLAYLTRDHYYIKIVETALGWWVNGSGGVRAHKDGFRSCSDWGTNPQASIVAFLAGFAHDHIPGLDRDEYKQFAIRMTNYILGTNPQSRSYLIGYGSNYPKRPHHRGAYQSQHDKSGDSPVELTGAVVGGIKLDGTYNDSYNDWVTNEVATGYNAPMVAALSYCLSVFS